jgi:hypothetical protein
MSSEVSVALILDEASQLMRALARPLEPGESVKSLQRRVHRRLRTWSWNRVCDIWRADPRVKVRAHEIEQLRRENAQRQSDQASRSELQTLRSRIDRLEAYLRATDPAFFGPQLDALGSQRRETLRALGARDRSDDADPRGGS